MRGHRTLLAAALLLAAACHKQAVTTTSAGDLSVDLAIDPDPPVAGDNRVHLTVRDADKKPVGGARVSLIYDMAAMGSMPEMKGDGTARELSPGVYEITYPLSMLGDWTVTVQVEAPGHPPATLRLRIAPPRKGFVLEGGGAPGRGETAKVLQAGAGKEMEVSPRRLQLIGTTFATVQERPLSVSMRAAGHVEVDERSVADVNLKYEAYVRRLFVAETGKRVKAGDPLLELYSPDLLAAEEELLQLRRNAPQGAGQELLRAATRRLRLWDLSAAQIAALEKRGKADGTVVVHATAPGVVLDKPVVQGMHAMAGTTLYRIGDLGRVWVQAEFHEFDAPFVAVGQPATVAVPALGDARFEGRVSFLAPILDMKTRTLQGRVELRNSSLQLRPGMFADVRTERALGKKVVVAESALLLSGGHRYAFVERGEGRLSAVEVQVGAQSDGFAEVKSGLAAGDRVVLGANFLVSSEAQLRDALPRWSEP
ncbi:MAG: hypothetical protein NVSMB23_28310 [Myxococcales bacterium]